ncbi:MAG: FeS-binding protein [Planctomycetes bacterium]|nr:FeS-binding protein [Planctomycetota bacterium]
MPRKYFLTIPKEIVGEPILYTLGRDFSVVPNIRGATISDDQALMAVELEGDETEVERAVAWLLERGVKIEGLKPDQETRL